MASNGGRSEQQSALGILAELAVEGTASLVEAQRTLLDLAQQENEILMNGLKQRMGDFAPAVAVTDVVRRGVDTLIGMQQELLTASSRHTLEWLESEKAGKGGRSARLLEFAQEGMTTFTKAQAKFLEALAQESARATGRRSDTQAKFTKRELAQLAREAGSAFIEAQKRLLDVMGQQMNVNLDVSARALGMMSPPQLAPFADMANNGIRDFVQVEEKLIRSLVRPRKTGHSRTRNRKRAAQKKVVV